MAHGRLGEVLGRTARTAAALRQHRDQAGGRDPGRELPGIPEGGHRAGQVAGRLDGQVGEGRFGAAGEP